MKGTVTIYGWHFIRHDKRLRYGDNRLVEEGKSMQAHFSYSETYPILCHWGMHASPTIVQAAQYGAHEHFWLCFVRVDQVTESDPDKFVGYARTALQIYNSGPVFDALDELYACQMAPYPYYWMDIINAMATEHRMSIRDIEVAIRKEIAKHNPDKYVPEVMQ